jgi:SH3 domain protein
MKQSICRLLITGVFILLIAAMAHAETLYVTDKMQITFRTGPGNDRKILSLLNSGQQVTFLQPEGEWANVSLQNGKEGWVLQRYLSAEVPCRIRIEDVSQALEGLKTELEAAQKTTQQLETERVRLAMDLKNTRHELANTKQSYEKLKKDAAGFLELKARHDKTVKQLSAQTQKADTLDKDLTGALRRQNIRWFLGGAGVLLFGFIMGFSSKRQKRHSSLL